MTLVEMAIVICLTGAAFYLLIGWMNEFQQRAKRDLALRLLADLDKSLSRYHRATGGYPPSYEPHSAITATVNFLDLDRTRSIMESLPECLWNEPTRRTLVDPWGTPLQYHSGPDSQLARANNGKPVFVSAGPDRDFGDMDTARMGDNLRSDDPGPEGFRLHDAMREPWNEDENENTNAKDHD